MWWPENADAALESPSTRWWFRAPATRAGADLALLSRRIVSGALCGLEDLIHYGAQVAQARLNEVGASADQELLIRAPPSRAGTFPDGQRSAARRMGEKSRPSQRQLDLQFPARRIRVPQLCNI
jgi:hypothetical protein